MRIAVMARLLRLAFAWLEPGYLAEEHEQIDGMRWRMGWVGIVREI